MKVTIKTANIYIIKAPSNKEQGEEATNITRKKNPWWEGKTPEEVDEIFDRAAVGIHDGLGILDTDGESKDGAVADDKARDVH